MKEGVAPTDEQKENLTSQPRERITTQREDVEQDWAKAQDDGEFRVPVEYASPMKRLWAWVGLVYAVGYALLMAYAFARGDFPQGIGQLLLAPALAGLGASVILRYREGKGHGGLPGRGGLPVCIGLSGVSFALALWNLIQGLPVLLGQL